MTWSRRKVEGSCSVQGCGDQIKAKGLCDRHYRAFRRHGDPTKIAIRPLSIVCSCENCDRRAVARGLCKKHYRLARKDGSIIVGDSLRDHPLYGMWWARRKAQLLSPEWIDDVQRFINDVGERPGKFFSLVTLTDGPFGPDNFRWREQIKRRPGESKKAFHARKWRAQVDARPSWDRSRSLKRKYGIDAEQYDAMSAAQGGVCAICKQFETTADRGISVRSLAVDHCHKTRAVRGLLCGRCNLVIGRVEESVETLRAMIAYLETYSKRSESS